MTSYKTQYEGRTDVIYDVVKGYIVWLGFFDNICLYVYIHICRVYDSKIFSKFVAVRKNNFTSDF